MTNKVTDLVKGCNNEPVVLSTGVKVKINPAPAMLVEQAVSRIKYPDVPVQTLEDGRKVENPTHPDYLQGVREASAKQSQVAIDVMIAFVDLIEPVPDDGWEKRLAYLEKKNIIDLGGYDLDDELDREFVYKKYVVLGNDDLMMLSTINGITEEDKKLAKSTFQSPA